MSNFERQIIGEIPLHEAASFFVGMKTFPVSNEQIKTAGARMKSAAQQQIEKLLAGEVPEGKAGHFKPVNEIKEASAAGKVVRRGTELLSGSKAKSLRQAADDALGRAATQVAPLRPSDLPSVRSLRDSSYAQSKFRMPKDSPQRAPRPIPGGPALKASKKLDQMAGSEAAKVDAARMVAAGAGGAAVGAGTTEAAHHKKEKKKTAGGRPAGMSDRQWIHEFYTNREKYEPGYSARMKTAALKLGFGANSPAGMGDPEANMEGGQPTPAASNLPAMPGASMAPPSGPIQDPIAARPSTAPTVPVNYMGAELLAQAAQRTNEVGFLRERLNAATEQNNMLTQQVQQVQSQIDQLSQSQQAAGDQIMQATNEAVASSTRALEHSMQAANMRMGIQKMREAMMELASQDPESMGTLAQQQQLQEESAMEQQAVNAGTGAPGQSPTPPAQPGAPAAGATEEGGPEEGGSGESGNSSGSPKAPQVQIKTGGLPGGAVIPGVLAGAGIAGLMGYRKSQSMDQATADVGQAEQDSQATGSFAKALELSKAKQNLAETEAAAAHPKEYTARSALRGAAQGGVVGHMAGHLYNTIKQQGLKPAGMLGKVM